MSKARFDRLDEEKRAKLLDCAAQEFAEKGFEGASLNRILERASMGKSSLYYYFEDKADLFATLLERLSANLFAAVGPFDLSSLTKENFWTECEAYYARCLNALNHDSTTVKLGQIFHRLRAEPKMAPAVAPTFEAARQWALAFLDTGRNLGAIRTDLQDSLLMASSLGLAEALDHWAVENWSRTSETARNEMARDHIGLFRRLLAP